MQHKMISLLGSTGSIGRQTLEICTALGLPICGLSAHSNVTLLAEQARKYRPKKVCIADETRYGELKEQLEGSGIELLAGRAGLCEIAALSEADIVVNAVVGMVGLEPTLAAIHAGHDVALANKETLVAGGALVTRAVKEQGVNLLPVDSEHSAIFQAIQGCQTPKEIQKIILTASGGPFYGKTSAELGAVTVADALLHPNWEMGRKISIDSATLMNKGLELIEAMWLFDLAPDQIEVVIHRQSLVHSAVEFVDHSMIAQLGVPDMRLPIQYALTYPARKPCATPSLSLTEVGNLTFAPPDTRTFSCLASCIEAAKGGGLLPAAVNAAGEEATAAFLAEQVTFLQIGELVEEALRYAREDLSAGGASASHNFTLDDILNTEQEIRTLVQRKILTISR